MDRTNHPDDRPGNDGIQNRADMGYRVSMLRNLNNHAVLNPYWPCKKTHPLALQLATINTSHSKRG